MVTHATLHVPASLPIGNSIIQFDQDEAAALAFIDGMTSGHLAYMVYGRKARLFDTDITLLLVARKNTLRHSQAFNVGYIVGYLTTLDQKQGMYLLTSHAFCEGHQEGLEAYCLLGRRHVFTLSEMCCLIGWKHQDRESAFHAGYIAGFIWGFTRDIRAILTLIGRDRR